MSNSPEMKAFIAAAERYLLSLGKSELNRRINSRMDGEIGKLILEAGFLEKENLTDEKLIYEFEDQIKYVDLTSLSNFYNWNLKFNFSSIDWSGNYIKRSRTSQPLNLQEMFFDPQLFFNCLTQNKDQNDYPFKEPTSWPKIA